jgi:hypothetical protein
VIFMTKYLFPATITALLLMPFLASAADPERQTDVAKRGGDVMPFNLKATMHIFTKTPDGGTQRVIARDASDGQQIQMVREHLRHIQAEFQQGDFAGPSHVQGAEMPGDPSLRPRNAAQSPLSTETG